MKVGMISSKDLFAENRMDAGFHLIKKSLVEDGSLARAQESFSTEEAKSILASIPHAVLKRATEDLVRGSAGAGSIERAIEEYPHMALAIAFRDEEAAELIARQAEELNRKAEIVKQAAERLRKKA